MTTLKLLAAALGTAAILATSACAANADSNYHQGNGYNRQHQNHQYHGQAPRNGIYIVPYRDFRRYVDRHGQRDMRGRRFNQFVHRHGQRLRDPERHYWRTHREYGWRGYWNPKWVYVDLRSGDAWF